MRRYFRFQNSYFSFSTKDNLMTQKYKYLLNYHNNKKEFIKQITLSNIFHDTPIFIHLNNDNPFNIELAIKCVNFKNDPLKVILYMEHYAKNVDKEILIHVIINLINNIKLNTINYDSIEIVQKICMLCINTKIKPYEFLIFLEKFYIKAIKQELDPSFLEYVIDFLSFNNFKTNDEYFCELLSKFILSQIANFNYQSLLLMLPNLYKFKYIDQCVWDIIEIGFSEKFSSLYKNLTIEALVLFFDKDPREHTVFWNLMKMYFSQNPTILKEDISILYAASSLIKRIYIKEIHEKLKIILLSYVTDDYNKYKTYLGAIINLIDIDISYLNKQTKSILNNIYQNTINKYNSILYDITILLINKNLIEYIDFSKIDDKDFNNFNDLSLIIYHKLEIAHRLQSYDKRFIETYKSYGIDDSETDNFLYLVKYLYDFKNQNENPIYIKVLKNFLEIIMNSNSNKLQIILTFPIIQQFLNQKILYNVVIKLNDDVCSLEDNIDLNIIKDFFYNGLNKMENQDIEQSLHIKKIRDVMNFSINEMNMFYNRKFYSSIHDNLYN